MIQLSSSECQISWFITPHYLKHQSGVETSRSWQHTLGGQLILGRISIETRGVCLYLLLVLCSLVCPVVGVTAELWLVTLSTQATVWCRSNETYKDWTYPAIRHTPGKYQQSTQFKSVDWLHSKWVLGDYHHYHYYQIHDTPVKTGRKVELRFYNSHDYDLKTH